MLKPYEEYQETEISWLEKVPSHWEIDPLGLYFKNRKTKVSDKDFPPLSVTKNGIVPQLANAAKSNDGDNRKLVQKYDFVVNSRSDRKGSSGISPLDGSVSLINIVLEPYNKKHCSYMHYLLRSHSFVEEFYRNGRGIVGDLWTTRYTEMRTILIPLPSQEEQNQIVRYLDWQTSRIDKLIEGKKKQIEFLKEQKQAVINKAVTKGLDDSVPMKDSGVAWLGEIPEHWFIKKFEKIAQVKSNLVSPDKYLDFPQVSPANIEKNSGKLLECTSVQESGIISDNHRFFSGQILYSKIRPLLNKVTIAPFDGLCSADMYPIETELFTNYLQYYMLSRAFLVQIQSSGNRVKMPKLNKEELSGILVVFPLDTEQKAIVQYIVETTERIDKAIETIQKEISLLAEYKTSLISSVVTGAVDVRGVEVPVDER